MRSSLALVLAASLLASCGGSDATDQGAVSVDDPEAVDAVPVPETDREPSAADLELAERWRDVETIASRPLLVSTESQLTLHDGPAADYWREILRFVLDGDEGLTALDAALELIDADGAAAGALALQASSGDLATAADGLLFMAPPEAAAEFHASIESAWAALAEQVGNLSFAFAAGNPPTATIVERYGDARASTYDAELGLAPAIAAYLAGAAA